MLDIYTESADLFESKYMNSLIRNSFEENE
jgi:hypothetical protein